MYCTAHFERQKGACLFFTIILARTLINFNNYFTAAFCNERGKGWSQTYHITPNPLKGTSLRNSFVQLYNISHRTRSHSFLRWETVSALSTGILTVHCREAGSQIGGRPVWLSASLQCFSVTPVWEIRTCRRSVCCAVGRCLSQTGASDWNFEGLHFLAVESNFWENVVTRIEIAAR